MAFLRQHEAIRSRGFASKGCAVPAIPCSRRPRASIALGHGISFGNTGKTPGTAAFFFWCGAVEYDSSYV